MAYITSDLVPATLRNRLDSLSRRMATAIEAYALRRSRRAQVEYYESLSDARLAEMGLKREDIVFHVFRDKIMGS